MGRDGAGEAPVSVAALPAVICFYTLNTPYEQEVKGLAESCRRLGFDHEIRGVPPLGSWEHNCAYKARYILEASRRLDRPLLWCDADAIIRRHPLLVAGAEPDFAISKARGWQFNSATVYFNRTQTAQRLMERWVELCEETPDIFDQIHLDSAWEEISATQPLRTMWLPQSYAKVFDMSWDERLVRSGGTACEPVIEQFQASRRFKNQVSTAKPRIMADPDQDLVAARLACRPREAWYDERFSLRAQPPAPAAWGLRVAG